MLKSRHGGRILADQLAIQSCRRVFCIPGESYLAALDGLHDHPEIETIVCRHESGAAIMAEAYGKMTGSPGICFVTRGPGATNASAGVHIAKQDSSPMILFIGQVGRHMMDREAFQEIDYRRMFGQMAKWVAQIDDTGRIPEYVSRAYHTALSGRPGPVVLALPEDMLSQTVSVEDCKPYLAINAKATQSDAVKTVNAITQAKKPFMIVGGSGWNAQAREHAATICEYLNIPVCTEFRCQDFIDNRHPNYAGVLGLGGDPRLMQRIRQSDLIICVGARLGEMPTDGYQLLDIPNPKQTFVHVHAGAEELGQVYRADIAINATSPSFLSELVKIKRSNITKRDEWISDARNEYLSYLKPSPLPGELKFADALHALRDELADDAFITNGAGNYSAFVHRYLQYKTYRTQLAPVSGSMGYALPSAISAKLHFPDRQVICFTGDGDFMMICQELATAVEHQLDIIIILVNNGMFGTIRVHQERKYPGRVHATSIKNPDFSALANGFGAIGFRVESTQALIDTYRRALSLKGPVLIEAMVDPDAISPSASIEQVRKQSMYNNSATAKSE